MATLTFNYDSFPDPAHLPKQVRDLATERAKFAAEARAIGNEVLELITGNHESAAREADNAAQAAAARAGEPDPGRQHTAAHRAALAEVRARQATNSRALKAVTDDLTAALTRHADKLRTTAAEAEDKAAAAYAKALDQARAAHDTYADALGVAAWAGRVTEALAEPGPSSLSVVFEPGSPDPIKVGTGALGTTLDTAQALDALGESAQTHTRRRHREADRAREAQQAAQRQARHEAQARRETEQATGSDQDDAHPAAAYVAH